MHRRNFVVGGGAAALTVAGLAIQRSAGAQDATPTPSTGASTPEATKQNQEQATYQSFVAALATNLGITDAAKVDTAIRTTLKQLVDQTFTAGHISADEANALKSGIDFSPSPIGVGEFGIRGGKIGGRGGDYGGRKGGRGGGRPGGENNGNPNGNEQPGENNENKSAPGASATPSSSL